MPAALCIAAVAGTLLASVPADRFELSWTHSVEKIAWREAWAVADGGLVLEEAAIRGHGAGMEVPDGAVLEGGWWRYRPDLAPLERVVLANSTFTSDYELCAAGACTPLAALTGTPDRPVALFPCP
ncbi:DUF1850 domain-containing protein [Arenibaculum sp.]|uniref:DUF1850 domain-containing protein n=1 Tax=Arenibaculum sp. TaxID=2865862 RepID=UPI002E1663D4|nr:DUF1850 domain-containing protein [Arenibaculum sp.]